MSDNSTIPRGGPCTPWGLSASIAWGAAAVAAWLAAQVLLGALFAGSGDIAQLAADARFISIVTVGAAVVPLILVGIAVRLARCGVSQYLGLQWPEWRYVLIGLALLAVLLPLVDLVSFLADRPVSPKFVTDLYVSARDSNWLLPLALALAVAAPIVEETIFRGFLLPGLSLRLGAWGAIVLSAVAWALLHAQYQPFYLGQIIALGVAFGWLRLRSGSTTLTMVLHGIVNLVSLIQAAIVVEWLS